VNPRRTFGPTVLVGLGSAALAAVAGSKAWALAGNPGGEQLSVLVPTDALDRESPLAAALALVVLATWGVLLVTRGLVRRAVAALGLIAALGLVATVVDAYWSLQRAVEGDLRDLGLRGDHLTAAADATTMSGWYTAAAIAAPLSVLALLTAVRFAPQWPEMGSRYDAPGGAVAGDVPQEERSNLDLWKSLDEGVDPTRGPAE
jgi:hypothetical protein